jgi:hypothetical protein
MHNARHEFLLTQQWRQKPKQGPPVGIAAIASVAIQDQVNNHAVVEADHSGQEHDEIGFAADTTDIGRSRPILRTKSGKDYAETAAV